MSAAKNRIIQLASELNHHNRLYYQDATPEISDADYDKLFRELEILEKNHPDLADPNSPTQRVGGAPLASFSQIEHLQPMLSIDDLFSESEVIDFHKRLVKNLGQEKINFTIEPKIDGAACSLVYKNGQLSHAVTRGDGKRGDDITANIRTIRSIPLSLEESSIVTRASVDKVIDFEAILPYKIKHERQKTSTGIIRSAIYSSEESLCHRLEADTRGGDGNNFSERLRQETQSILEWGVENHRILDGTKFQEIVTKWPELGGQSEHAVFYVHEHSRVIKFTLPPNLGAQGAIPYLKNIRSCNRLFRDDIEFHGIIVTDKGPTFVTSQKYVHGTEPSLAEIADWFKTRGYHSIGHNRWKNEKTGTDIADAHQGNLIKTADGELLPIDLQVIFEGHIGGELHPAQKFSKIPALLEVRGEVFMPADGFAKLNESRDEAGLQTFANPRNAAAGTLKLLDPKTVAARPLDFIAHGIGAFEPAAPEKSAPSSADLFTENSQEEPESLKNEEDFHDLLDQFNIRRNQPIWRTDKLEGILSAIRELDIIRHDLPYGTDGAVIKVIDYAQREKLGFTSRAPRWVAAFKYPPEQAETTLRDITIQVGRTGVLTPVAELDPVLVSGSTVSRATLHNDEEIQRKKIYLGAKVLIEKAGEIIPAIVKVLDPDPKKEPYSLYDAVGGKCPSCHAPISKESGFVAWRCTNFACPAQAVTAITHFAARKALDLDGLGESVAIKLVETGLATTPLDLFSLSEEDLANLHLDPAKSAEGLTISKERRFGEKRANTLLKSLKRAENEMPLPRWIFAMGIPHIGESAANEISRLHENFSQIPNSQIIANLADLPNYEALSVSKRKKENHPELAAYQIEDSLGPVSAASLRDYFLSEGGQNVIAQLAQLGINPKSDNFAPKPAEIETSNLPLDGKTFVITGTLSASRPDYKKLIEKHGGKVTSALSKSTDYLLAGEKAGSKLTKAASLEVPVLTEADLQKMITVA